MADTNQPIGEFVQNLLSDLDSGTLTAQEAITAAGQYAYLREAIANNYELLSAAEIESNEALASALRSMFSQVLEKLNTLPSFQSQSPDKPLEENDVREVSSLRQSAIDQVKKSTNAKLAPLKEKRRAFIHNLVEKYSSSIPKASIDENKFAKEIDHALITAASEATTTKTKERFEELLSASAGITEKISIRSVIDQNDDYVSAMREVVHKEKEVYNTLFTHAEVARPDVVADILIHAPANEPAGDSITRSLKLAGVAESLQVIKITPPVTKSFFSTSNAKGVSQGAQKAADGILSLISEPIREIILKNKIEGTLRNMFSNTQGMIDRLGENFVRSSAFANILQQLTHQLGDKAASSGVKNIFDDVFSSVFRGPLNNATNAGARDQLLDYFELSRANINAPKGKQFLPTGIFPWNMPVGKRPRDNRSTSVGWFPLFGLGALGSFGSWISDIASFGFDQTTSFFLSGPRIPQELSRSRRAAQIPTPIWQDMPALLALIVVILLVILFIFPSPFNGSLVNFSMKANSFLAALGQGATGVINNICDNNSTLAMCKFEACVGDCRWPTTGTIIQGPFATCNGTTHSRVDAIDFRGHYLEPIYSITDGRVSSVVSGCADNPAPSGSSISQGCNQNYGNYVEVTTTNGAVLRYSHLSILFIDNIKEGPIKKGDPVGKMDNNGSSGSHHLHLEVRGGSIGSSKIASFLPGGPDFAKKLFQCINTNGCNSCPQQ